MSDPLLMPGDLKFLDKVTYWTVGSPDKTLRDEVAFNKEATLVVLGGLEDRLVQLERRVAELEGFA